MTREEEIPILIDYLKNDIIRIAQGYPNLLSDRIIRNGKLIEAYKKELEELKK